MPFYIKERHNPQLGTYFVGCGKLLVKHAKKMESSLYGFNTMHRYESEQEYNFRLEELIDAGERVQRS